MALLEVITPTWQLELHFTNFPTKSLLQNSKSEGSTCHMRRHSRHLCFWYIAWHSNNLDSSNELIENILYTHTTKISHKRIFVKFVFIFFMCFIFLFVYEYSFISYFHLCLYIYFYIFIFQFVYIFILYFYVFNFLFIFKGFIQTVYRKQFSITRY